jgi:Flp pilus assembly pilin Flp
MARVVQWYLSICCWRGSLTAWLRRFLRHDRPVAGAGQAFLEYALVIAVVAVIVLVAVQAFGVDLTGVFDRIRSRLGTLG